MKSFRSAFSHGDHSIDIHPLIGTEYDDIVVPKCFFAFGGMIQTNNTPLNGLPGGNDLDDMQIALLGQTMFSGDDLIG